MVLMISIFSNVSVYEADIKISAVFSNSIEYDINFPRLR